MEHRLGEFNRAFSALAVDQVQALSDTDFKLHLDQVMMIMEVCNAEFHVRTAGAAAPRISKADPLRASAAQHVRTLNEQDFCAYVHAAGLLLETYDAERKRRLAGGAPIETPSIGRA